MAACQANPTYLDKFYGLQPGRMNGAKRLILLLPSALRDTLSPKWLDSVAEIATLVWQSDSEQARLRRC